jgi:hypothetical protein
MTGRSTTFDNYSRALSAEDYELLAQNEILGLKPRSPRKSRPTSEQELDQKRDHQSLL